MAGIAIGVDNFYYAEVLTDSAAGFTTGEIKRVKFLNEISIEPEQDTAKAYGDNQTAAMAVSNGDLEISTTFVTVPHEDRAVLAGATVEGGAVKYHKDDVPPDVAIVWERTNHDGSSEWFACYKGKFMRASIAGKTKEDSYEFQNAEMSGSFIPREADGFTHGSYYDEKGETTGRDKAFKDAFGKAFPTDDLAA